MKSAPCQALVEEYAQRAGRLASFEAQRFASEEKFLGWVGELRGKARVRVVLFDSRGKSLTSEELADRVKQAGVGGLQHLVFAIGPPDGWSAKAHDVAEEEIAFGRITLPHELALVLAAEQLYRALSILSGHPYHSGH